MAKSTEPENMRIRLDAEVKERWDVVLRKRKISQQTAVSEMIAWVLTLEPLHQAIIFGQAEDSDRADIAKILLQRMANQDPRRPIRLGRVPDQPDER